MKNALKEIIPKEIFQRNDKSSQDICIMNLFRKNGEKLDEIFYNSLLVKQKILNAQMYKSILHQLQYTSLDYINYWFDLISLDV